MGLELGLGSGCVRLEPLLALVRVRVRVRVRVGIGVEVRVRVAGRARHARRAQRRGCLAGREGGLRVPLAQRLLLLEPLLAVLHVRLEADAAGCPLLLRLGHAPVSEGLRRVGEMQLRC